MKKTLLLIAALLSIFALCRPIHADRVRMRSGKIIEGILSDPALPGGPAGQIRMWVGSAQISLPADQVDSITTDTMADNLLIDAQGQLDGGRAEDGAEKLGQAAEQEAPPEKIALLIVRYGDLLAEHAAQMKQAARDGLSLALSRLETTSASQSRDLTARRLYLHVALGEAEKAEMLVEETGPQYYQQNPAERNRLASAILKALDAWSEAEDFASAEGLMQMLQRVDPRRAEGAGIQFYLAWGSCERRSGRHESALRIYTRQMLRMAPEIALERTTSTLMMAEKDAREKKQLLGVIGLYETYGKPVAPRFTAERLAQIWHDEGMVRYWDNRTTEAQTAFMKAEEFKKGAATRELLLCQYRQRRALLTPNDHNGHLSLGDWCMANDLHEEALAELALAQEAPRLADEAGTKIESIRSKLAEARLAGIMELYEKGNYAEVLEAIPRFMREDHPKGYLAQAKQILDMTQDALKMRVALRPQQAESLYRQAERAFYEEDYRKARGLIETLTSHYRDTVTYPRAAALGAMVDQKLAVEAMEANRKPSQPVPTPKPWTTARITTGTAARISNAMDRQTSAAAGMNAPVRVPPPAEAKSVKPAEDKDGNQAEAKSDKRAEEKGEKPAEVKEAAPQQDDGATTASMAETPRKRGLISRTFRKIFGKDR